MRSSISLSLLGTLAFLAACSDTTLVTKPPEDIEILDGSISGRVCDPSGRTWLQGATAYVNLVDDAGVVFETRQSVTDAEGRWSLTELPGDTEYDLYVQYGTDVLQHEPIWVASGDSVELEEPECFDPLSLEIAIVTGSYDNFDVVLTQLGFVNYTTIDGLDGATLSSFLGDPAALAEYDIIFFNGGHQEDGVIYDLENPDNPVVAENIANLRAYVEEGGAIYGSDWAYDVVELTFPDQLNFVGADEIPNDAQRGDYELVNAAISDANLASYLGKDYMEVQFDLPVWPPIEAASSSVSVHLTGTVPYSDGMSEYTLTGSPLLVSFNAGQGKVVFSTFRVVPNANEDLRNTLQYIMYNL